jgi:pimeloyl-ACP methyl ester carboxylesterase
MPANIIYLHGFASSPHGAKVSDLRERLAAMGITLRAPDLNVPDFTHLMISAMIDRMAQEVAACPPGPVYLIGSSLGGYTALHFLDRRRDAEAARVAKLILLAPALDFGTRYLKHAPPEALAAWEAGRAVPVMHFGAGRELPLGPDLMADAAQYGSGFDVTLDLPVLILHGRHDESVPVDLSLRFATGRSNVRLCVLDTDHGMVDELDTIWAEILPFFSLQDQA